MTYKNPLNRSLISEELGTNNNNPDLVETVKKSRKKKVGRKRKTKSRTKTRKKSNIPSMKSLSHSLKEDCMRFADYLKQESHRQGYVY